MARADVRDFLADRKELTIDEGDDPLKVVYRPARINAQFMRSLQELGEEEHADSKALVFIVCTVLSDWNLTGPLVVDEPLMDRKGRPLKDDFGVVQYETRELVPEGQKVPIKSEYVKHLPSALLGLIWNRVTEDMRPDPKSESDS